MSKQHSIDNCPLRTFSCITTTDTPPYRILDLDSEALDLFLYGFNETHLNSAYSSPQSSPPSTSSSLSPFDYQFDLSEARTLAKNKALGFLRGLSISDVLLPDSQSCLNTSTSSTISSSTDPALYSFIIAEEAILTNDNTPFQGSKPTTRRVHSCIHYSSTSQKSHHSSTSSTTPTSMTTTKNNFDGRRFYLVKDVTEMHNLAITARSGVRLCGNLGQPQQPFSTRPHSSCRERGTEYKSKKIEFKYNDTHHSSVTLEPTYQQKQQHQQEEKGKLSNRDSGIILDEQDLHSWSSSTLANIAPSPSFKDPGILILQVTRFGTIDHAFAIPQSDFNKEGVTVSCDHPLFLAQSRASIESLANNSIMSQVHPHDLTELCYGLDQVCKALYTSFRARWRVHAFDELSIDCEHAVIPTCNNDNDNNNNDDDEEDDEEDDDNQVVTRGSNLIEFQGVTYEEWVDPHAISDSQFDSSLRTCGDYVWAEVTGVLSGGSPVLVVRPLTMAEAAAHQGFDEVPVPAPIPVASNNHCQYESNDSYSSYSSYGSFSSYFSYGPYDPYDPYYDGYSDDDEGYLEMEMEEESGLNDEPAVIVDFRVYKDQSWRRMDHGEGLCLSHNNVQGLSDLGNGSSGFGYPCMSSKSHHNGSRHNQHHHRRHRSRRMVYAFSPLYIHTYWPAFTSAILGARRQWIHTIHLTQEQLCAWCEYLLDTALDQTLNSVSLGLTLLGHSHPKSQSHYAFQFSHLEDSDSYLQQRRVSIQNKSHDIYSRKLSGLYRARKVLEANYPSIDVVVRQIGRSWIARRIIARGRLDQKIDIVADQVVDWLENKDRVMTLTSSLPMFNTLTTYTPLYFLTNKARN